MEKTAVEKLARILRLLILVTFACNLIVLPLVPGLVGIGREGAHTLLDAALTGVENENLVPIFFSVCWQFLFRIWRFPQEGVLAAFLLFCGANTAFILWQAKRVLDSIISAAPFQLSNARNMDRAAISFGLISLAALCRTVWGFCYYRSIAPLFTYNALFVPVFAMGALLCLVMGALFRQAAVLKTDSDLTI